MKKVTAFALGAALALSFTGPGEAADSALSTVLKSSQPACVMLDFADETSYKELNLDERLAQHVLDRLMEGDKVRMKSNLLMDADLPGALAESRVRENEACMSALQAGDYSGVFENPYFASGGATVEDAREGDVLDSSITRRIGEESGAEYLIQGSVLQLGEGININRELETAKTVVDVASHVNSVADKIPGINVVAGLFNSFSHKKAKSGILADLKVIKASTGEVVWRGVADAYASKNEFNALLSGKGKAELSSDMEGKMLTNEADKLVEMLEEDIKAGKVFK